MFSRALSFIGLCLLLAAVCSQGQEAAATQSQFQLTEAHLNAVGLRFPAEFKSISELSEHAAELQETQEIKLGWDSFPGRTSPITATEAHGLQVSRKFVVQSRQFLAEPPRGQGGGQMRAHTFLFVAVGKSNQIRGMAIQRDPRVMSADGSGPNRRTVGGTLYQPKAEFTLRFPNDPAIRHILIYEPKLGLNGFQLSLLADVELKKIKQ